MSKPKRLVEKNPKTPQNHQNMFTNVSDLVYKFSSAAYIFIK